MSRVLTGAEPRCSDPATPTPIGHAELGLLHHPAAGERTPAPWRRRRRAESGLWQALALAEHSGLGRFVRAGGDATWHCAAVSAAASR
ncbi:hypothetical protein [Nocardia africana]|uniref:hypothetical protein n=1 Tax=Nocardia africana TaxID=134964 RepID=UPI001D14C2F8|nr:hypothetical protein [Nocardia africana]MCC3316666.1 hypothetical protein [Nocardia africana]